MKKILSYFTLAITIISCSPKLGSEISNKQSPLTANDLVVVLQKEDEFKNDGIEIGKVRSSDNGFSTNCTYAEVISKLVNIARQNGANILKITDHKVPDQWSTCDRIKATIYKVDNPGKFEKEIEWNKNRKLVWDDFKGKPKIISNEKAAAETYCGLGFQTNRVTAFKETKIFVRTTFDCNLSWARKDETCTPEVLEHEQGHFDLCEVYARQLRKKLRDANMTVFNLNNEANSIYKQVYNSYLERQELYEQETKYGLDRKGQENWNNIITSELMTLEAYTE